MNGLFPFFNSIFKTLVYSNRLGGKDIYIENLVQLIGRWPKQGFRITILN